MQRVWVFTLSTDENDEPYWYWTRKGYTVIEPKGPYRTFEACLEEAKQHGFDFSQPYHVTASRSP